MIAPADRLVPEPLLNASLSPYDPSCRLPGTNQPHLTRCGGGTHRIVPRLGKRLATDRGRRQRRLRHQGLPGERRAIHEPQLQARHSHRNDRGGFSYIAGQSLYETPASRVSGRDYRDLTHNVDSITNSSRIVPQDVRSGMYSSLSSFPPVLEASLTSVQTALLVRIQVPPRTSVAHM